MNKLALAVAAAATIATTSVVTATPAFAQHSERHPGGDRTHGERGHDRGDRGGHDRGDRGGGDYRRGNGGGDYRRHDNAGRVIGSILGGFLLGENLNYRFNYDGDYYARRGYDRGYYDNWSRRDRGSGCASVGYGRGCRTIHYDRNFMILNLQGEVYCYRRSYRGGWTPTYCPRNFYDY